MYNEVFNQKKVGRCLPGWHAHAHAHPLLLPSLFCHFLGSDPSSRRSFSPPHQFANLAPPTSSHPFPPDHHTMEATLITRSVYDDSNSTLPQGMSSPSALSPNLGSTTSPTPAPLTVSTMASAHDHADKLDQLDPSSQAWSSRYFGQSKDVHITFEQPTPEQMIQQQMLSQSRNLLMQSMAARDMVATENSNKPYAENNFTGKRRSVIQSFFANAPWDGKKTLFVCPALLRAVRSLFLFLLFPSLPFSSLPPRRVVSLCVPGSTRQRRVPSKRFWLAVVLPSVFLLLPCALCVPYRTCSVAIRWPFVFAAGGVDKQTEQRHAARGDWGGYMQQRAATKDTMQTKGGPSRHHPLAALLQQSCVLFCMLVVYARVPVYLCACLFSAATVSLLLSMTTSTAFTHPPFPLRSRALSRACLLSLPLLLQHPLGQFRRCHVTSGIHKPLPCNTMQVLL